MPPPPSPPVPVVELVEPPPVDVVVDVSPPPLPEPDELPLSAPPLQEAAPAANAPNIAKIIVETRRKEALGVVGIRPPAGASCTYAAAIISRFSDLGEPILGASQAFLLFFGELELGHRLGPRGCVLILVDGRAERLS